MSEPDLINNRDYVVVVDKSRSMNTEDCDGKSRWVACQESTEEIAEYAEQYDPDGLTVYTFSSLGKMTKKDNVTSETVGEIFDENKPGGSTYLTQVLRDRFQQYLKNKVAKKGKITGETMVIITDGAAKDQDDVIREIIAFSHQLDHPHEYGIAFVQIGHDQEATDFLAFLDDNLKPDRSDKKAIKKIEKQFGNVAKYDIVDTKTLQWVKENKVKTLMMNACTD